ASPAYRARCERIKHAIETHGSHNTYFLYNANCKFHLTNDPALGMLEFRFEGTALTDASDEKTVSCDLEVSLVRETCDWLKEPIVQWFVETVPQVVKLEFDAYIKAGDLARTIERARKLEADVDRAGGYLGMGL
ncbi:MAG: hypothetical protein AB7U73_15900, partial [Pirellulales bacterium]